jgi:hypothetical protein
MAKLVIKGSNSKSRLWLARRMAERLAAALPGRRVLVTADSVRSAQIRLTLILAPGRGRSR